MVFTTQYHNKCLFKEALSFYFIIPSALPGLSIYMMEYSWFLNLILESDPVQRRSAPLASVFEENCLEPKKNLLSSWCFLKFPKDGWQWQFCYAGTRQSFTFYSSSIKHHGCIYINKICIMYKVDITFPLCWTGHLSFS